MRFVAYNRVFTLKELRKCVVSWQPSTPFHAWDTVQSWAVIDLLEFMEELAESQAPPLVREVIR